jgi:hypothetical protein
MAFPPVDYPRVLENAYRLRVAWIEVSHDPSRFKETMPNSPWLRNSDCKLLSTVPPTAKPCVLAKTEASAKK